MSSSLSSLVDNLSKELHDYECTSCKSCLDNISTKGNQLIFKCIECSNNYKKYFNKYLVERFENTHEFCHRDTDKSILLLRKGVYPYEYMYSWERFNEKVLPNNNNKKIIVI